MRKKRKIALFLHLLVYLLVLAHGWVAHTYDCEFFKAPFGQQESCRPTDELVEHFQRTHFNVIPDKPDQNITVKGYFLATMPILTYHADLNPSCSASLHPGTRLLSASCQTNSATPRRAPPVA